MIESICDIGRVAVFTTDVIMLQSNTDIQTYYDQNSIYQTLSSLPTFTYVIMGNIILLFIVELIVQNLPKPHPVMTEYKSILAGRKRFVSIVRGLVIGEITIVVGLFFTVMTLKVLNKDKGEDTNQAMRVQ